MLKSAISLAKTAVFAEKSLFLSEIPFRIKSRFAGAGNRQQKFKLAAYYGK